MRRFLRLTIGGCILLLLLCGGAVVVGRMQPARDVIPGLAECDGLPCYRGIVLNKTTIKDALATLKQLPGAALGLDSRSILLPDGPIKTIHLFASSDSPVQTDSDIVREINFELRANTIDLGTLIAYAGTPCALQTQIATSMANGHYLYESRISYPMMYFWVEMNDLLIAPHLHVDEIDLIPPMAPHLLTHGDVFPYCDYVPDYGGGFWKGFIQYPVMVP